MNTCKVLCTFLLFTTQWASAQIRTPLLLEFDERQAGDPIYLLDEQYGAANSISGGKSQLQYKVMYGNGAGAPDTLHYVCSRQLWNTNTRDWNFDSRIGKMGVLRRWYDESGNPTFAESYRRSDNSIVPEPENRVVYDYAGGKIAAEIVLQWKDSMWKNSVKYENEYDDRGNILVTKRLDWSSDSPEPTAKNSQLYSWKIRSRFQYTYNKDNKVEVLKIDRWAPYENRWIQVAVINSEYKNGKLVRQADKTRSGNKWEVLYKLVYRYDDRGRAIQIDCLNFFDKKWKTLRHQFYYGGSNNIDSVVLTRIEDRKSRPIERFLISYNEYGQPLVEEHEWYNGIEGWHHTPLARKTIFYYKKPE